VFHIFILFSHVVQSGAGGKNSVPNVFQMASSLEK